MNNIIDNITMNFVPGETYRAQVKLVHQQGVSVEMPCGKGSGIISTRCWGNGLERANALAAIAPGDEFEVSVRKYDAQTKSLSLVLCGFEDLAPLPKKAKRAHENDVRSWADLANYKRPMAQPQNWSNGGRKTIPLSSEKPVFRPIAKDALLCLDLANVIGALSVDEYIPTVTQLFDGLAKIGYMNVIGFIERRTIDWLKHTAATPDDVSSLESFCRDTRVTIAGGESDIALCQTAKAVDGAIIISRDRMLDYAEEFGDIVNNRIRSFGVVHLPTGALLINIDGISDAVVINKNLKSLAA